MAVFCPSAAGTGLTFRNTSDQTEKVCSEDARKLVEAIKRRKQARVLDTSQITGNIAGSTTSLLQTTRVIRESERLEARNRMLNIQGALEQHFALIGHGPYQTPLGREQEYRFWRQIDPAGAAAWWIIDRINDPCELHILWGIGSLLAAMAPISIEPILFTLDDQPSVEQADTLLSAIASIGPAHFEGVRVRLAEILARYLHDSDDAVRIRAAEAASATGRDCARLLLNNALQEETDEDVQATLAEELANYN